MDCHLVLSLAIVGPGPFFGTEVLAIDEDGASRGSKKRSPPWDDVGQFKNSRDQVQLKLRDQN